MRWEYILRIQDLILTSNIIYFTNIYFIMQMWKC